MDLVRLIGEFQQALVDEIRAAHQGGGQRFRLHAGHRIGEAPGAFLYAFEADAEFFVPDDAPVELQAGGATARGVAVAVDGPTVLLELDEDLGEEVPRAVLHSEPWELLEALKGRLAEALLPGSSLNAELGRKVLGYAAPQLGTAAVQAEDLLRGGSVQPNAAQLEAVGAALGSEVQFVWGPPGTGKTWTLGLIGRALHEAGETLLVASPSNAAVDAATLALAGALGGAGALAEGTLVRVGAPRFPEVRGLRDVLPGQLVRRRHPGFIQAVEELELEWRQLRARSRERARPAMEWAEVPSRLGLVRTMLAALRGQLRALERDLVRSAPIVACTLAKAAVAPEVFGRRFDAVAVDDASMASVPAVFFVAALATKRCLILGDFRQLPPVALARTPLARKWLRRDIFAHAGIIAQVDKGRYDPRLVLLDTQYRMHPQISRIVSRVAYGGRLLDGPAVAARTASLAARPPEAGEAVIFYDLGPLASCAYRERRGEGASHFNPVSAATAFHVACRLLEGGTARVGLLTPYAAQARLLRRMAQDCRLGDRLLAATVHRFQGAEREAVVFDLVDALPLERPGVLLRGDADSDALRLLTVALSRPRGKLVLLGDLGYLRERCGAASAFAAFLWEILAGGVCMPLSLDELRERTAEIAPGRRAGIDWYGDPQEALGRLEANLAAARREVVLAWPGPNLADAFPPGLLAELSRRGVHIGVAAPEAQLHRLGQVLPGAEVHGPPVAAEGCALVDGHTFWLLGGAGGSSGPRPALRVTLPGTAGLLADLLGLPTAPGRATRPGSPGTPAFVSRPAF